MGSLLFSKPLFLVPDFACELANCTAHFATGICISSCFRLRRHRSAVRYLVVQNKDKLRIVSWLDWKLGIPSSFFHELRRGTIGKIRKSKTGVVAETQSHIMSELAPHVPCFALLVGSNTLAYSTFGASMPLLPLLLPVASPIIYSSIVLIAFVIPALFVNPIITSKRIGARFLSAALIFGAFLEAIGPLLLSSQLAFTHVVDDGALPAVRSVLFHSRFFVSPSAALALITAAMFISGFGAAISQYGLVRLIGERMEPLPLTSRRQSVGVHIAVLEAGVAVGTMVSPVLFAFIATTRRNVFVPFLVSGVTQLCLACCIACALPAESISVSSNVEHSSHEGGHLISGEAGAGPAYGSVVDNDDNTSKGAELSDTEFADPDEEDEEDPGLLHALRHPWVWMILFSLLVAASSASFLRPVLTPRVMDELQGSRLFAAALFSLCAFFGVVSEWLTAMVLSAKIGIRNTVILGLLVCLGGFRVLAEGSLIAVAVILIAAGSSTSLVLTVTDLSQTTQVRVSGISNSLSLLAAFIYSVGEIVGTVVAGVLYDTCESFEEAVARWYRFMVGACAIVLAPYLLGLFLQCLSPWMFLVSSRGRR